MNRKNTILDLLDALAPEVQAAFLRSVQNIQSDVQLQLLIGAYESGDIDGFIRLLNIENAYFAPLDQALSNAYAQGGDWAIDGLKAMASAQGATIVGRFDGRNPRAEAFLRDRSSGLIVEIVADQVASVRTALAANMTAGVNAKTASLDVVGRVNRATGRREGGLLGLTKQQAGYTQNAMAQLRSGDPAQMADYLTRKRRDKRFDATVRKAIKAGKPVSSGDAQRMVNRYTDRLLKLRGETISRTELLGSLHHAQNEGLQQMIDAGRIEADAITRTWDASNDGDTRDSHRAMEGTTPDASGAFTTGDGYRMRYPGDVSLGAPAQEVINCRCRVVQSIDFLMGLRRAA